MKTDNLERNDLSPGGFVWLQKYLRALDAGSLDDFSHLLAEDCVLQINNSESFDGKSEIRTRLRPIWESFRGVQHDLLSILGNDRHFALEGRHSYAEGGRTVVLRGATITERNVEGHVESIRVYFDSKSLEGKS